MIDFVLYYLLVGAVLVFQHSVRFYLKNKTALKLNGYLCFFDNSKGFYFLFWLMWFWGLDFLIEVNDYNELRKDNDKQNT